ncbi:prolipoprotein diacylglyceryl transferase [Candidatus Gracilibacteria bacterium]|nr:prolipoprotein diacylglyceryl transferase [Candidatus Gracilibacteria bacterium]
MYIFDLHFYALHIAPTWYGLSYALGFIICYFFMRYYFSFREIGHIDTLLSYIFAGIILGGRIGYIVLYNLSYFIEHPMNMIRIWEGGMSFHGGLIGTILAVLFFAWRYHYPFWSLIDTLAIVIPVALGLGRVGNWINQELPGYTPYDGIFPMQIAGVAHFPSPLLEMLLEGVVLFIVMLIAWRSSTKRNPGFLSGIFLIGYSVARLIAEQYRLPDSHIGYLLSTHWLTLGIVYTVPMMVYGVYLVYTSTRSRPGRI